jgi:nicotinate-nucleotide adenylyltransferase
LFADLAPATRERIELLPSPRITISATAIRHRISQGQTVRYLVPDPVSQYIADNKLYQLHEDS